jgi:hypothetical protein
MPLRTTKEMKNEATNRPTNNGRQGSTGGNSVYVAIAGEVVNRRSVLLRNFVLNGQASDSNPLLHIHAKR